MIKHICTSPAGVLQALELPMPGPNRYPAMPTLTVEEERKCQPILGFGAAFTDGACYTLGRLEEDVRKQLMEELFSGEGLGLSVGRLAVGASDYATECYSYNDTADDLDMRHFSIEKDRGYTLPIIRQALGLNPELFLYSSTWSPPGWMKTGGSMCGGWLRPEYLEAYANYYTAFLKAYLNEGVPIRALTCQNEPETDQTGAMPACLLHPSFEAELVGRLLPPRLEAAGLHTELWLVDHNYAHWPRGAFLLEDADVARQAAGVAFHPYQGTPDMVSCLKEKYPQMAFHLTETGPNLGADYGTDWCEWGKTITEAMNNWCQSFTGWNLALDERGNPNTGPFFCAGLVTVDSQSREITYSGQYRAFAHFSKYVRRGAIRLGLSQPIALPAGVYAAAFQNPDGQLVLVLTNMDGRQEIQLSLRGQWLRASLPEKSLSTLLLA